MDHSCIVCGSSEYIEIPADETSCTAFRLKCGHSQKRDLAKEIDELREQIKNLTISCSKQ